MLGGGRENGMGIGRARGKIHDLNYTQISLVEKNIHF